MINLLIALLFVMLIAYCLYWAITTFFPDPIKTVAPVIVGLIVLLALLGMFAGHVPALDLGWPRAR